MASSSQPPPFENRQSPRVNWMNPEVQVIINAPRAESKVLGWIQDISQGGFKLKTETPLTLHELFQEWDEIYFEMSEDFFQLKGQGRVMWTSSRENMAGIRIDHLDEESRKYLSGFLGIFPVG